MGSVGDNTGSVQMDEGLALYGSTGLLVVRLDDIEKAKKQIYISNNISPRK